MANVQHIQIGDFTPLNTLGIENNKQLYKFYKQWSVNASKLIKKYATEHSIDWYNTAWRNKSKEIPFYIRTKAPKSFIGNVFFASNPPNYAVDKSVGNLDGTYRVFPVGEKRKPALAGSKWFMPKTYKEDVKDIDQSIINSIGVPARFFVSQTSHNKTHKYKKPMLWYQSKSDRSVAPVTLKEQMSDYVAYDTIAKGLIEEAFELTVNEEKYLK